MQSHILRNILIELLEKLEPEKKVVQVIKGRWGCEVSGNVIGHFVNQRGKWLQCLMKMQRPGDVEMWLKVATSAEIVSVACHISRSEILGLLSAFWVILSSRNQLQLQEVFKNKIPKFTCAEFLYYYLYLHAPEAAPLSSSPGMWLRRWCLEYLLENSLLLRIFVPITVPKSYSGQKERIVLVMGRGKVTFRAYQCL